MDFSDPEKPEGNLEKLAIRFNKVEQAKLFKEKFEAAQQFYVDAKAGKELTWANTVEDIDEKPEDDIDMNMMAEAEEDED